jgi:hypothetical protein
VSVTKVMNTWRPVATSSCDTRPSIVSILAVERAQALTCFVSEHQLAIPSFSTEPISPTRASLFRVRWIEPGGPFRLLSIPTRPGSIS